MYFVTESEIARDQWLEAFKLGKVLSILEWYGFSFSMH